MNKIKPLYGLKYVTWIDSSMSYEQIDRSALPVPVEIYTVGFVVDESPEYITLAREVMEDGDMRGVVTIPMVSVRGIRAVHMPLAQAPMPSHEFPTQQDRDGNRFASYVGYSTIHGTAPDASEPLTATGWRPDD